MKKLSCLTLLLIIAGLIFNSCSPQAITGTPGPAAKATTVPPKTGWEHRWETTLAEAKKEGSVSIYTLWRPDTRIALTRAFKEKYGIDLEFSPFGRGAEMAAKVQAEQRAGLYAADAFGAGAPSLLVVMKSEGFLGPIEPSLVLPEVLEGKVWHGGKFPFLDKENLAVGMIGVVIPTMLYNTDLIKEGEITGHKDLLKPQYKGKITLNDPTVTGAGPGLIAHLGENLWGEAEAADFLRRLVKEQEVVIQRDTRAQVETVARGKYAIAMAPSQPNATEFLAMGAPVKFVLLKEDNRTTISSGGLSVPKRLAHPNAATVFVNWLLTREGQSVFAKSFGTPSTRVDASAEGIDPLLIPKPSEKYYAETEEFIKAMNKWAGLAKKIIDDALK